MRILTLTKRQYTSRDLLDDRFGRLRELPLSLAGLGHQVSGLCLSYRPKEENIVKDSDENGNTVTWHSLNLKRIVPAGSSSYWKKIEQISYDFRPDLIWACSDAIHAIIGANVSRKLGTVLVIDLYDNFESFELTRFPGMTSVFRNSLRSADGIICVSKPLSRYVFETTSYKGPIEVIENAVPKGLFRPQKQSDCRQELGLPDDAYIVGTAGAISKSRGIEILFQAFEILAQERPDVRLALAGPCDRRLKLPVGDRFHYLGVLPPHKVSTFLCSLDISVICNRDSAFGRYCFPQKFFETVACRVPVVAAATGSMREMLDDKPQCLFKPENINDLAAMLRVQLVRPTVLNWHSPTWDELGLRLAEFLEKVERKKAVKR